MPRSKIVTLPRPVRERLDVMLIERGFSGYQQLADWLAEQGHSVSHMSVYRYGTKLEKRLDRTRVATQQAEALRLHVADLGASRSRIIAMPDSHSSRLARLEERMEDQPCPHARRS